ncbi:MAG: hypothetical protein KGS72_24945 [Cyanobacteria bacterium REEB67]|nr:hypothetical protein [Cyanobacteria bacterium REEB67]
MQTSIPSPVNEHSAVQSLVGQIFCGTVSVKQDDSLIIAIADPHGALIPVPGILPKDGLIGFTPTIKETRFSVMENGDELFVRVTAVDLDSETPGLFLNEVSSLR